MGLVRMGPPEKIISKLKELYEVKKFVETGTYYGNTAYWASKLFERVSTIEYSETIYKQVTEKYGWVDNIEFLQGDSREKLSYVVSRLDGPSIFWLDAHWSGGATYGDSDQCPILEEIDIINRSNYENFIFIDDARLFLSPPQPPHQIEQWPDINAVLTALNSFVSPRYTVIIEDAIVAVPEWAKPILAEYCQEVNKKLWEEYKRQVKTPNYQKGMGLIYQDLKRIGKIPQKIARTLGAGNK